MIKYKFDNMNFWINQEDGSLNVETEKGITVLPYGEGKEMLRMLGNKITHFEVKKEMEKKTVKQKIRNFLSIKPMNHDWQNSLY